MPTFLTETGKSLPTTLEPLDPRHALMLLDWVFFKPSHLKQYLYRADADLYRRSGLRALRASWRRVAYRRVYLTAVTTTLVLFGAFSLLFLVLGLPLDGWSMIRGLLFAALMSAAFAIATSTAGNVGWGVATGVAAGITFGVVSSLSWGAGWLSWGIALGVALGLTWGTAAGYTGGVALGLLVAIVGGVAEGLLFGVSNGIAWGIIVGLSLGLIIFIGALRLPFYLVQLLAAAWASIRGGPARVRLSRSPALHDEYVVFPFPGLNGLLGRALNEKLDSGVGCARTLLRNSFQSWAVSRAFSHYLSTTPDPLKVLYEILDQPGLDEYVVEPLSSQQFSQMPGARAALLGQIGNVFVDISGRDSVLLERLAWSMTRPLRGKSHGTLLPLIHLLLEVEQAGLSAPTASVAAIITSERIDAVLPAIQELPHGLELLQSFQVMLQALQATDIESIAGVQAALDQLSIAPEDTLRRQVLERLRALGDVSLEVARYQQATSPSTRAAAVNRAIGMLSELAERLDEMRVPERTILRAIIQRWQQVVSEAAGRLGEQALREMSAPERFTLAGEGGRRSTFWERPATPFPNPYIAGRPVEPPLFVGRRDILNRILEHWQGAHTPDSIILYGHRRMGKTSILRNLADYAPPDSLLAFLDLKGERATARHLGDLFLSLADAVHATASKRFPDLPAPDPANYAQPAAAKIHFERLLREVLNRLPPKAYLILTLDEFESLQEAIEAGDLPHQAFDLLRSLSQQRRVALVLAGLHTLDEMSRDYQQAFFSSYVNVKVSYLTLPAAEQLIARPMPDFALNYHPDVLTEIFHLTHGQPLLIQRICQELVFHLNHELFDLDRRREVRVLPADLRATLTDEFLLRESRYFDGIWNDQIAPYPDQAAVMYALARVDAPLAVEELAHRADLDTGRVQHALAALDKRDLVACEGDSWNLLMPLIRRWLRLRAAQSER
jgi:hypothetical protein